jgi:endonuclease I
MITMPTLSSSATAMGVLAVVLSGYSVLGQPGNYYKNIDPTKGLLKEQLQPLLFNHTVISYSADWDALGKVDRDLNTKCTAPQIPDIYSANCWNVAKGTKGECGNYKKEGDCWNREHGWPKSWWGGFSKGQGAQTDLHELWASDGYVNNLRGNLPLGEVSTPTYTSSNGAKIGPCTSDNAPPGDCFEIGDEFKGDIARSYFYLATTYMGKWSCCDTPGVNGSHIKPWMEAVLRKWHDKDPPTDLEMKFNNDIFAIQKNRSPFIDHPEWVAMIPSF